LDAAQIDGASEYQIIYLIIIPVLTPTIAAISMFLALNKWNMWFPVMLYTNKKELWTLQYFLRVMVFDKFLGTMNNSDNMISGEVISPINYQMAAIILVAFPIVSIYPFVQKYFVKGILVGSVKG
jgi:putative aldouronate transport system permease protein